MAKKKPRVKIETMSFDESYYLNGKNKWTAPSLYKFAKKKKYKEFKIPLAGIDLTRQSFNSETLANFIFQVRHRVCKAILKGKREIKAIRLKKMPKPDKSKK